MLLSVRSILVALIVVPCLSVSAVAEDKFPWQATMRKFVKMTSDQKQIYLDSFFESMFFILYGITDANNPEALKEVNGWIDCVIQTRKVKNWTPDLSWALAENMDKGAAWVLYHKVAPVICHGFDKNAGTNRRLLRIYTFEDWERWAFKTKAIYLAGFLDTMATFEDRLKEQGMQNHLAELRTLIESVGIDGILAEAVKIRSESKLPLAWTMAAGVEVARNKTIKQ
jgi:hypothetical protein